MSGFFDIYSIIFLVIAVVIFMRLGSVLGRRTGNEPTTFDPRLKTPPAAARNDNVVALPPREHGSSPANATPSLEALTRHATPGTPLHDALAAMMKASPGFNPDQFLTGARAAYEMIVTAYAEGDRPTLKNLLAPDVYDGFIAAITEREKQGQKTELTFIGLEEAKLTGAESDGRVARLAVRFVAELISVTRDKAGAVVDGDPTEPQTIRDAWTFARDLTSRDPNWKLVATEAV